MTRLSGKALLNRSALIKTRYMPDLVGTVIGYIDTPAIVVRRQDGHDLTIVMDAVTDIADLGPGVNEWPQPQEPPATDLSSQRFVVAARAVLASGVDTDLVVHLIASELDPDAFTGHGYGLGAGAQAREQALDQARQILERIARSHA